MPGGAGFLPSTVLLWVLDLDASHGNWRVPPQSPLVFFLLHEDTKTVRDWHESSSPTNAGAASIWYASFQITNWKQMLVWKNITQMFHVWNIFTYILIFICMVNVGNYIEYLGQMKHL